MGHSLEWINELLHAEERLNTRHTLRLFQAVATIMDGEACVEMQQRLIDQINL